MEKFHRWRDPGTGIQPFVPLSTAKRSAFATVLYSAAGLLVLLPVRIAALSLSLSLLSLGAIFKSVIIPFLRMKPDSSVGVSDESLMSPHPILMCKIRPVRRVFEYCGCRIFLLSMGVWYIRTRVAFARRGNSVRRKSRERGDHHVKPHVIVCNRQSWIDIMCLKCLYGPTFTQMHSDLTFTPLSFLQAIRYSSEPRPKISSTARPLGDILEKSSGPICIFPEGTTGNGKGLLKFLGRGECLVTGEIELVVLKYDPPMYTLRSPLLHGLSRMIKLSVGVTVIQVLPRDVKEYAQQSPEQFSINLLADLMSQVGRYKQTAMSLDDKLQFLDYWHKQKKRS